jgi:hypothetical protein
VPGAATSATTLPAPPEARRLAAVGSLLAAGLAAGGLAAALGACTWLVLAAAERPSVLSPPTIRAAHRWLLGPLSGALPHLTTDILRLRADYTTALVVLLAAWLVAWAAAPALRVEVVAGAVGLAQLVFLLGPPQPLTDFFNYIVYGRMAAAGVNPYTHAPVAGPRGAAYALSNWHHLPSPYGPLFTLIFEPLSRLPLPVAYWTWKVLVVASALGVLALVWWLARRFGRSPQRALVFAGLCPVTLAMGIGAFHNDMPAVLCVVAAFACLVRGGDTPAEEATRARAWNAAGGALAVAAAALKPSFVIVVPLIVLGARRRPAAALGAGLAAGATGLLILTLYGGALPALGIQGRLVNPFSLPSLLGVATGHGGADSSVRTAGREALAVVVLAACALVAWRRRWTAAALGLVLFAAVLSLSWIMPWYLAWALPFAALARPRALVPLSVVACLWLGLAGIPQMPKVAHALGYYPTRSATGHANHELAVRLVR